MARIDSSKAEIQKLSENWAWSNENLKLAGIGTPQKIVDYIMNNSEYKPFVPSGSIRKNKDKITDFEAILAENGNFTL